MIAIIPVRQGSLPVGADESVAEAGGRAVLIGDEVARAAESLSCATTALTLVEAGSFAATRWAIALAGLVREEDVIVLPGSPDGRDLAPHISFHLGRPLLPCTVLARPDHVVVTRAGGRVSDEYHPTVPFVATLDPGTRTFETRSEGEAPPEVLSFDIGTLEAGTTTDVAEPEVLEVTPPDPKSMDLGEAKKIFGGGAGLGGNEAFDLLLRVSASLGASMGATRVVTDAGHVPHWRQIGTTGVTVDPDVYVAFGVSGAVQHTGGLGDPKHIISVNTDPSCPMMTISDLAIVADAGQVLAALAEKLGIAPTGDLDG